MINSSASAAPVLATDDLSVELGGLPVLRGISCAVQAGETVALMGGNGSGKSTLVRAMLGLTPAQRGTIDLLGTPLARFRDWRRIGYVPQRSAAALSGAKVQEVVTSGRLARRKPFLPASRADRAAVQRALELVGMADRAHDRLAHLSGGQQQRVLIARALAGEPELLVLDEPNAGVDLEHQQILAAVLSDLVNAGTSVLAVLHEVGALGQLIDRSIVLGEGRVIYDGAPIALSAHDHLHHQVDEPAEGVSWIDPDGGMSGTDRREGARP